MYFDLNNFLFFNVKHVLSLTYKQEESNLLIRYACLVIIFRIFKPLRTFLIFLKIFIFLYFLLTANLALPFEKNPIGDQCLWKPPYRWKVLIKFKPLLSVVSRTVNFWIIYRFWEYPTNRWYIVLFKKILYFKKINRI